MNHRRSSVFLAHDAVIGWSDATRWRTIFRLLLHGKDIQEVRQCAP